VPTSTILLFFTGRMPFLPPNQQCQSTEGKKQPVKVFRPQDSKCESDSQRFNCQCLISALEMHTSHTWPVDCTGGEDLQHCSARKPASSHLGWTQGY